MLGKCISSIRISKILLGEDPDPPHRLRNFGARRVGLHPTWSAPKQKILATPLMWHWCLFYWIQYEALVTGQWRTIYLMVNYSEITQMRIAAARGYCVSLISCVFFFAGTRRHCV